MRNLIKKILMESDFEWAEDLINDDNLYGKLMSSIPNNDGNQYLILFERGFNNDEAIMLLKVLRSKGWETTGEGFEHRRIYMIVKYSKETEGYVNLKNPTISFGPSSDVFSSVNGVEWDDVPKIKI